MVSANAIDFDVFQKTLAEYGAKNAPPPAPAPAATPVPALPSNIQPKAEYQTATPPNFAPQAVPSVPSHLYANGRGPNPSYQLPPQQAYNQSYGQPQLSSGYTGYPTSYGGAPQQASVIPDALAAIPEEQRAMLMHVLSMTPEQLMQLPPEQRASFVQLRATLGLPTV